MIAAAVLTRNAILETHNTQEFCMISGLRDEDLTLPDMSADTLSGV
jgi:predicted nucleic acid-binding protein